LEDRYQLLTDEYKQLCIQMHQNRLHKDRADFEQHHLRKNQLAAELKEELLSTVRKLFIYHIEGRKVGVTTSLNKRVRLYWRKGETQPLQLLEVFEGTLKDVNERECYWADYHGYHRGPSYSETYFNQKVFYLDQAARQAAQVEQPERPQLAEPRKGVRPNESCPCGSGEKYKHCCHLQHVEERKRMLPPQVEHRVMNDWQMCEAA
jgi:hypothetical protein